MLNTKYNFQWYREVVSIRNFIQIKTRPGQISDQWLRIRKCGNLLTTIFSLQFYVWYSKEIKINIYFKSVREVIWFFLGSKSTYEGIVTFLNNKWLPWKQWHILLLRMHQCTDCVYNIYRHHEFWLNRKRPS